jgi:hypothetical protein
MASINPGYRGLAVIPGIGQVRFGDANITAKQEINAPDLIMGDWDHDAYVYGKIEVGGSISGPVTETFIQGALGGGLWDWGVVRTAPCGTLEAKDLTLYYYCEGASAGSSRAFSGLKVNSLNFNVTAGDIANFSIDVMGTFAGTWGTGNPPHFTDAEKLITWDKTSLSVSPGFSGGSLTNVDFQSFDFTIGNNLEPQYTLDQPNLFPVQIVDGLRTITGSLSVFNTPHEDGAFNWDEAGYTAGNTATIVFDIGGLSIDMKVQFHRVEPASTTGAIVSTVAFTGVTHQTGSAWEA